MIAKRICLAVVLMWVAGSAMAQNPDGLSLTEVGTPGDFNVAVTAPGTGVFDLNYLAQNSISDFRVTITYDETVLTVQETGGDVDGCLDNVPSSHDGSFTACTLFAPGEIRLTITELSASGVALPTTEPLGTISFDVANGAQVGPQLVEFTVVEVTDDNNSQLPTSSLDTQDGTITVSGPSLTFNPVGDNTNTLDTGSAPVGSPTTMDTVTVTETGTDDVVLDSCAFSGANAGDFSVTYTGPNAGGGNGLPATFIGGDGTMGTLTPECTPGGAGTRTATLTCNVEDGGGSSLGSRDWPMTCEGTVPNVGLDDGDGAPIELNLSANVGGPADTGNVAVFNTGGADANSAVLNMTSADATEIGVSSGLADATISAGTTAGAPDDTLTFSCSSPATANVTETFNISYDDLGSGNSPTATITVNCEVTDTAPEYNSVPIAPNGTFAFGTVANGGSASLSIDVFNDNDIGDPFNITGVTATGSGVYSVDSFNSGPYNGASGPDGGDDITVSCNPDAVGTFPTGNLEVVTDTAGTHNYDLTCEGTGPAVTSTPPDGGKLSLGTVTPGTMTPPGSISVTNNTVGTTINLSCDITGDQADLDAFGNPASPIAFSLQPGETNGSALTFECTPPDVNTFSIDLSCSDTGNGIGPLTYAVNCSGRPLVVPTLSHWGLLLMALFVLGIGGLVGRRMMS